MRPEKAPPFGLVPVEVASDPRLTLQQMRVLIALYTFRDKNTELARPSREEISERTGMALSKISTATTDLERLGWLTKVGNGGRSQATRYHVHVPQTITEPETVTEQAPIPEQVTVTESETVTESARNGYRIGNETVTESGRGKEQTIQTRTDQKKKRASASTFELPDWINKTHWDAWHSCAKRRNATDAQKQMAVQKLDAWRQAGIDHAAALENAAIAGWQGLFKPDVPASAMTAGRRTPAPDNFAARTYTGGKL